MKKLLTIGVVAFIVFLGCSAPGAKDYWPLAEGNRWTYTAVTTMTFADSTSVDTFTVESTVDSKVNIGDLGEGWLLKVMVKKGDNTEREDSTYVYKGTDTVYVYSDSNGDTLTYLEPVDLSEGTRWTFDFKVNDTLIITHNYEVVSTEDVTVPAGTFSVIKVKDSYSYEQDMGGFGKTIMNYEGYTYKAAGVGVVKYEYTQTTVAVDTTGDTLNTSKYTYTSELESYEVK